jgi:hypothetical protein
MKLLTKALKDKLLANGKARKNASEVSPVVKFFNPMGAATWLFTELDADGDTLYGLCDLGMQSPELGYASLSEIEAVTLRFRLKIERDLWFKASKTLAEYADDARAKGRIDA